MNKKLKYTGLIISILVIGIIIGMQLGNQYYDNKIKKIIKNPYHFSNARTLRGIKPNKEQRKKIKNILDRHNTSIKLESEIFRKKIYLIKDSIDSDFRKILDKKQYRKFKKRRRRQHHNFKKRNFKNLRVNINKKFITKLSPEGKRIFFNLKKNLNRSKRSLTIERQFLKAKIKYFKTKKKIDSQEIKRDTERLKKIKKGMNKIKLNFITQLNKEFKNKEDSQLIKKFLVNFKEKNSTENK